MDVTYRESRAGITEPAQAEKAGAGSFLPVAQVVDSIASGLSVTVRRSPLPIEKQWIALLARWQWQWFATFTFEEETHPEAAVKAFRHWTKLLDESNGYRQRSSSTHSRRCIWARGLEWQKRGVIHFHALIGNIPYTYASLSVCRIWQETWFEMQNTGICRIEPVAQTEASAAYISKYCAKGGEIDLCDHLRVSDLVGTAERS